MAFESVSIQTEKTPAGVSEPVVGWRQDLDIGDVLVASLTSIIGVSSYEWSLIGRPEGSVAGGTGPEPISLGTGATCTFTVDSDTPDPRDGTYNLQCRINSGAPNETIKTVGLARLNSATLSNGDVLRLLGGFETFEDTSNPLVKQGWVTMLNRWLRKITQGGGGSGYERFWDPSRWYVGVDSPQGVGGSPGILSYTVSPAADFIYAFPVTFDRAGTITAVGQQLGAGGAWVALYTSSPSAPQIPTTRKYDTELAPGGFNKQASVTGLSIPVAASETVWFACVITSGAAASGIFNVNSSIAPRDQWGVDWAGINNTAAQADGTFFRQVGYRHSFPYARLPDPFPASPTVMRSNSGTAAIVMYKFTPA